MWCSRALGVFLQITKARNNLAQSYRLVVVVEKRDRERVRGSTVLLNLVHFRILFFFEKILNSYFFPMYGLNYLSKVQNCGWKIQT